VQKALKGVDYPASKEELADHAAGNGADLELADALRGMERTPSMAQRRHESAEGLLDRLQQLTGTAVGGLARPAGEPKLVRLSSVFEPPAAAL
jgi:hypothetical protein